MAIDGIKIGKQALQSLQKTQQAPELIDRNKGAGSFADMFVEAVKDVDQMQKSADKQIEGLVLGKGGVTTHDAMIALEKADIAFQLMNSIRGKIVRAYEEVMRTQV